jgi:hypothetical protein
MNWTKNLVDEYYDWLKTKTFVNADEKTGWISIKTPFIGLFNDIIEIYVQKKGNKIILSDNGETYNNLELVGVTLKRAGERKNLADRILLNYGIGSFQNELILETTEKLFSQKKHNFISAILELNDLSVLSKSTVTSVFKEDVNSYLKFNKIIATPDYIAKGSTGLEFMFDFQIAGMSNEIIIKTFNSLQQNYLSAFLFSWGDIKVAREKVSQKTVSAVAIINNIGNSIKPEYLEALDSVNANYILWDERNNDKSLSYLKPTG